VFFEKEDELFANNLVIYIEREIA